MALTPAEINALRPVLESEITELYVSYWGRAADPEGLEFWVNNAIAAIDNGQPQEQAILDITGFFAESAEAKAQYGFLNNPNTSDRAAVEQFVNQIYVNSFGRNAEAAGLKFWSDVLQANPSFVPEFIQLVINGAQNEDKTTIENRKAVSLDFTNKFNNLHNGDPFTNTPSVQDGVFGPAAGETSQTIIRSVTAQASTVTAAKAATDAFMAAYLEPVYSLQSTPATSVNEGQSIAFTLDTTYVAPGTVVTYQINGITSADVVGGQLTGTIVIGSDGTAAVSVNIALDALIEGNEQLTLNILNQANQQQLLTSRTVTVNEVLPTYALTASSAQVSEGGTVTFTLVTSAPVQPDTTFNYTITGVQAGDVSVPLAGTVTTDVQGRAVFSINVAQDTLIETETLNFSIAGQSVSVAITDVPPVYGLTSNVDTVAEGGTVIFTFTTSNPVQSGASFNYTITGVSASDIVGGALTGQLTTDASGQAILQLNIARDAVIDTETLTLTVQAPGTAAGTITDSVAITNVEPGYGLSSSVDTVAEGGTVIFTFTTSNPVQAGASFNYTITGVQAADLVGGQLTGTLETDASGQATLQLNIARDVVIDTENLTLTVQAPGTATGTIADSVAITNVEPGYSLSSDVNSVLEGGTVIFTFETNAPVQAGAAFNYEITGVTAADIVGGVLTGQLTTDASGKATLQLNIAQDALLDPETLTLTVQAPGTAAGTISDSVTVIDVPPVYTLTSNVDTVLEGGTVIFTFATASPIQPVTSFNYQISGVSAADLVGGVLTGQVTTDVNGIATLQLTIAQDAVLDPETLVLTVETPTGSVSDTVAITDVPPVYTLTPTVNGSVVSSAAEGTTVVFTFTTQQPVQVGKTFSYEITGITTADLVVGGQLTGQLTTDINGVATLQLTIANDVPVDPETLTLTVQVPTGTVRSSINIIDVPPSYSLTPDVTSVNEGQTVVYTFQTSAPVQPNTSFSYVISGIEADDILGGQLAGTLTTDSNGRAVLGITIRSDAQLEGNQTLTLTVGTSSGPVSSSVTVVDIPVLGNFILTLNTDNFVGGDFADTFRAQSTFVSVPTGSTLGQNDLLIGGLGEDTLFFSTLGGFSVGNFTTQGIETVEVTARRLPTDLFFQNNGDIDFSNVFGLGLLSVLKSNLNSILFDDIQSALAPNAGAGILAGFDFPGVFNIHITDSSGALEFNFDVNALLDTDGEDSINIDLREISADNVNPLSIDFTQGPANVDADLEAISLSSLGGSPLDQNVVSFLSVGPALESLIIDGDTTLIINQDLGLPPSNNTMITLIDAQLLNAGLKFDYTSMVPGTTVPGTAPVDVFGAQGNNTIGLYSNDTSRPSSVPATNFDVVLFGGNDSLFTDRGSDSILGGGGNDTIRAGFNGNLNDSGKPVSARFPNDSITNDRDVVNAGEGNNSVITGDGTDSVIAGAGNDSINTDGSNYTNRVINQTTRLVESVVFTDDDIVNAGAGNNTVSTGKGNDSVIAGDGNDSIFVFGNPESVVLPALSQTFSNPTQTVSVSATTVNFFDNDTVNAGGGNNTVIAGAGNDSVIAGAGNDRIDVAARSGLPGSAFIAANYTNAVDNDSINLTANAQFITPSVGADNDTVNAGDGNNTVFTGTGNDSVISGSGNDYINVSTGLWEFLPPTGQSPVPSGNNTVVAGDGNNTVIAGWGNDSIITGNGNDTIVASNGNNTVRSNAGNDVIVIGNGNDVVIAGAGNDTVAMRGDNLTAADIIDGDNQASVDPIVNGTADYISFTEGDRIERSETLQVRNIERFELLNLGGVVTNRLGLLGSAVPPVGFTAKTVNTVQQLQSILGVLQTNASVRLTIVNQIGTAGLDALIARISTLINDTGTVNEGTDITDFVNAKFGSALFQFTETDLGFINGFLAETNAILAQIRAISPSIVSSFNNAPGNNQNALANLDQLIIELGNRQLNSIFIDEVTTAILQSPVTDYFITFDPALVSSSDDIRTSANDFGPWNVKIAPDSLPVKFFTVDGDLAMSDVTLDLTFLPQRDTEDNLLLGFEFFGMNELIQGSDIERIIVKDNLLNPLLRLDYSNGFGGLDNENDVLRLVNGVDATANDLRNIYDLDVIELSADSSNFIPGQQQVFNIVIDADFIRRNTDFSGGNNGIIIVADSTLPPQSILNLTVINDGSLPAGLVGGEIEVRYTQNLQVNVLGDQAEINAVRLRDSFVFTETNDNILGTSSGDIFTVFEAGDTNPGDRLNGAGGVDTLDLQFGTFNTQIVNPVVGLSLSQQLNLADIENVEVILFNVPNSVVPRDVVNIASDKGVNFNGFNVGAAQDEEIDLLNLHLVITSEQRDIVNVDDASGNATNPTNGISGLYPAGYFGTAAPNLVLETGGGNDTITSSLASTGVFGNNWVEAGLGNDSILMGEGPQGGGNDTLLGQEGNDFIGGGAGNDSILGGPGQDTIVGGTGNDTIVVGNDAPDSVLGGAGNDSIVGGDQNDTLIGNEGDDTILGNGGNDTILGNEGNDSLLGGLGNDTVLGGTGNDTILGNEGADSLLGEEGNDSILGGADNDTALGGLGNDTILGEAGADSLLGNDGEDSILGGADNDTALGGLGNDTILGEAGADSLLGEDGNDSILGGADNDTALGGNGNDTILGEAGDDSLLGEAGNDSILAGTGNDTVLGGADNDTILGEAGDDSLLGEAGNDSILGGTGNDTIDGGTGNDTLLGNEGNDSILGGDGNDTLNGGDGEDTLLGNEGCDTLFGGNGNDTMNGGNGTDNLVVDGDGSDTLNGGDGIDNLILDPAQFVNTPIAAGAITSGTTLDLNNSISAQQYGFRNGVPLNLTLLNIENIDASGITASGTALNLIGNSADNVLIGGNGADTINGGIGNDTIIGDGNSAITVDIACNVVLGQAGGVGGSGDLLIGGAGADSILGEVGDDTIEGGSEADTLDGGEGTDLISGGTDNDSIRGGAGKDTIDGGDGNDTIDGGTDSDLITGGFGNDSILGDQGNDTIDGGANDDTIDGGAGNDSLLGGAGNDTILGGADEDFISGGIGNDSLDGGTGNDTVAGAEGNDTILGNAGNDSLDGGAGNDTLNGGAGNDSLVVSTGDDTLNGDADTDTLIIPTGVVANGTTIDLSLAGAQAVNVGSSVTLISIEGIDASGQTDPAITLNLIGDGNANQILGGAGADFINGAGGNDTLRGLAGNDSILGGAGNDFIDGGLGNDTLDGEAGDDTVIGGEGSNDSILGGTGNDSLDGGTANDTIQGGDGNDTILGGVGNDSILGGEGNDSILGQDGDDTVSAGNGNDVIDGGVGNDQIFGEAGNDTISGGAGNNTLNGGTGLDSIVGGQDADFIDGSADSDTILGGSGNDTIQAGSFDAAADSVLGEAGRDSILGGDGNDTLLGGDDEDSIQGGADTDSILGGAGNDVLFGDGANDTILGEAGQDFIAGGDGDDSLLGGDDSDVIFGGAGADIIKPDSSIGNDLALGEGGNDTIFISAGNDTLDGGADIDTLVIPAGVFQPGSTVTIDLNNTGLQNIGNDTNGNPVFLTLANFESVDASGADVNLFITGTPADNTLVGGLGNDTLLGGDGNDSIVGNAGNDSLLGGADNDTITGNDGNDSIDGDLGNDSLVGGAGNDTIAAGVGIAADTILGDDGNDSILGGLGTDSVLGGNGNDTIISFSVVFSDTLSGEAGNDSIVGGLAGDSILGGADNDTIFGDGGNDTIFGGTGNDSIAGGGGLGDIIDGGADNDTIAGGTGFDSILGGTGNDSISGGADADTIDGGANNDTIFGDAGTDSILGGTGSDSILGGTGSDIIDGGADNDTILGEAGDDSILGSDGDDTIEGGQNDDTILGGNGNDLLLGGTIVGDSGFDSILGGNGNDTIDGGTGSDNILGEAGNDSILGGGDFDLIDGGTGNDTIDGGTEGDTILGDAGTDSILGGAGFDSILGGADADTILGGGDDDTIFGEAGADSILGGTEADSILGGTEADTILGGTEADIIQGEAGNDSILGEAGNDSILGGTEADTILGGADADTIQGEAGNDSILGEAGADSILGGTEADTILGGADGDTILGDDGTDSILGGADNDSILGEAGNDTLVGGTGADTLTGGSGVNTFVAALDDSIAPTANAGIGNTIDAGNSLTFGNGVDIITDLFAGDVLDLASPSPLTIRPLGIAGNSFVSTGDNDVYQGTFNVGTGVFTFGTAGGDVDAILFQGNGLNVNGGANATILQGAFAQIPGVTVI